jgi:Icc-related predicted phosphoesterase
MTRVVAVSDTHMMHEQVEIPEADILVHAGDFSGYGTTDELKKFVKWLRSVPCTHKVFIAGNHDRQFVPSNPSAKKGWKVVNSVPKAENVHFLHNSSVVIDGIKFYGSPTTPTFGNWHYMKDRGYEIREVWANIPDGTDVLITHGPPYGHGDLTIPRHGCRAVGCLDLLHRVREVQPKFHIFGHIHSGYSATRSDVCPATMFVNAANADDDYQIARGPICFSI